MSMTVADIAKAAFDGVAASITDAILAVTVDRKVDGARNADTGKYTQTDAAGFPATGRCVIDTVKPPSDIFPDYTAGPSDQLILIEGVSSVLENDTMTAGGKSYHVQLSQDILGAGSLFYIVGRAKSDQ